MLTLIINPFMVFCLFLKNRTHNFINSYFLLGVFFIASISTALQADTELAIGVSHYPPFQVIDDDGNISGLDVDIMNLLLADAGFKPHYKIMPWARQLQVGIKNGDLDILLQAKRTKERERFAYFSDAMYLSVQNAMFIRKQDEPSFAAIKQLDDIIDSALRVGIVRGSVYSEAYAKLEKNPKFLQHIVQVSNTDEQLIAMLLAERIDAFFAADISTAYLLKDSPHQKLISIHMQLEQEDSLSQGSLLMFSKASMTVPQVLRINHSLNKLLNDGSIARILANYKLSN